MDRNQLEKSIVNYLITKLGTFDSKSLINKLHLSDLNIFENEQTQLFGLMTKISSVDFVFYHLKFAQDNSLVMIHSTDLPSYALYADAENEVYKLFCKTDSTPWMNANTFLQATFLAGMEQIDQNHPNYTSTTMFKFDKEDVLTILRLVGEE